jgi:hypothetical protein
VDPIGFLPIVIGSLFIIASLANIEWLMRNKGDFLIKILGRQGVRGWLLIIGLFFIAGGIFILLAP